LARAGIICEEVIRKNTTTPSHEFEHTKKDLDGFQKLFHRFLQEKGPSVDWGKIQRPPDDLIQPYEKKARGWWW
jgi:UTP--glucose-1-phosphate uridylyltransferase